VTRGRAKKQKTVTPSLTPSTDTETDGHAGAITVALPLDIRLTWICDIGSGNTAVSRMRNKKYAIQRLFMAESPKFSRRGRGTRW